MAKGRESEGQKGTSATLKYAKSIGIVCVWIALWAVAAWAIGSPIILASPYDTLCALGASVVDPAFWAAIGGTFWHIAVGLLAACVLGCAAGVASARWRLVGDFLSPAMTFVKSAPIVCFIVLMLVWFGSTYVDLAAVVLAVLPVYYFSMAEAYRQRDMRLADMLRVFRVPLRTRLRMFEWPSVRPFFTQSTRIAVGMAWKSGVTAELIGLTFASIGEQIYLSKLTLDTAGLLMWTIVIVLLSWACERLVLGALGRVGRVALKPTVPREQDHAGACGEFAPRDRAAARPAGGIALSGIAKSFAGRVVLDGFTLDCPPRSRTCIMAQTGAGKTTLLNIVLGLLRPDGGRVAYSTPCSTAGKGAASARTAASHALHMSAVFQDERLLASFTAAQNVAAIAPTSAERARQLLAELLGPQACDQLPAELSGGMKRCVEICRALAAPSACVVMDEPFAGLDAAKKQRAIALINRELDGRTLLLVTHDRADADALGCTVVPLQAQK